MAETNDTKNKVKAVLKGALEQTETALGHIGGRAIWNELRDRTSTANDDASRAVDRQASAARDSMHLEAERQLKNQNAVPSYHTGGTVRKTGLARLLKGERVLNRQQARKSQRGTGRAGGRS